MMFLGVGVHTEEMPFLIKFGGHLGIKFVTVKMVGMI